VAAVRGEVAAWTARQSKHAGVGYPLLAALVCLEDDAGFAAHADGLVDALHRQLRDKLLRTAMLGALVALVRTYLLRHAGAAPQGRIDAWLARATRPVLAHLRKANLQFAEQQDAVVALTAAVAAAEPHFGVGMVAELLAGEPVAWDAAAVGLRALRATLLAAPAAGGPPGGGDEAAAGRALLDGVAAGRSPLGALGVAALAPRLGHALARVLQAAGAALGGATLAAPPRALADLLPKERGAGLPVLAAALAVVPFLLPEHWEGARLASELPGAPPARPRASQTARRGRRLRPGRRRAQATRSTPTPACAARPRRPCTAACARCPSCATACCSPPPTCWPACRTSCPTCAPCLASRCPASVCAARLRRRRRQALREALALAAGLAREWRALLEEGARAGRPPARARLDADALQGAAAVFLCAAEPDVRRAALGLLAELRALHAALLAGAGAEAPGAYLVDVLEDAGADIARRCYWDFGRWSDTWRAWRAPAEDPAAAGGVDLEARPPARVPPPPPRCSPRTRGARHTFARAGPDAARGRAARRGALGALPGGGAPAGRAAVPGRRAGRVRRHHRPPAGAAPAPALAATGAH